MLKVISVCHDKTEAQPLINSLERHNWPYEIIETPWRGFGTKLIGLYEYLKANKEVTHFIFCDAFDVVVLGDEHEFFTKLASLPRSGIVCSAERGLWPSTLEQFRGDYEQHDHGFNFINSGLYMGQSEAFIKLFEANPPEYSTDDQEWFNRHYIFGDNHGDIVIDTEQLVFNSHSHMHEGDYTYNNGRVQINGNEPVFIHSNGRTVDPQLDELLKNII